MDEDKKETMSRLLFESLTTQTGDVAFIFGGEGVDVESSGLNGGQIIFTISYLLAMLKASEEGRELIAKHKDDLWLMLNALSEDLMPNVKKAIKIKKGDF